MDGLNSEEMNKLLVEAGFTDTIMADLNSEEMGALLLGSEFTDTTNSQDWHSLGNQTEVNIVRFTSDPPEKHSARIRDIASILRFKFPQPTVRILNLSNNGLGDELALGIIEALGTNTSLITLNLGNNDLTEKITKSFDSPLRKNSTLQRLLLANNKFGDNGITGIANAIQYNTAVSFLDLQNTNMGDAGATKLANMLLQRQGCILELHLMHNKIRDEGGNALIDAHFKLGRPKFSLDLRRNKFTTAFLDGCKTIAQFDQALNTLLEGDPTAVPGDKRKILLGAVLQGTRQVKYNGEVNLDR